MVVGLSNGLLLMVECLSIRLTMVEEFSVAMRVNAIMVNRMLTKTTVAHAVCGMACPGLPDLLLQTVAVLNLTHEVKVKVRVTLVELVRLLVSMPLGVNDVVIPMFLGLFPMKTVTVATIRMRILRSSSILSIPVLMLISRIDSVRMMI